MRQRKKRKRIMAILAGIAVMLFVSSLVYMANIYREYKALSAEKQELRQELEEKQAATDALRSTLEYTQTDDFAERAARELLGWILPGEMRIVTGEENS